MLRSLSEAHPLISFYRDFRESRRCKVFDTVESWLRTASEAEKSGKLSDFNSWLSGRFQRLNKRDNLWPCLTELAVADHLLRHAVSVRFDDSSLSKPPDFQVHVDGRLVLIEAKLAMHEFARDLDVNALICEANSQLIKVNSDIELSDNWDCRCLLLAQQCDVKKFHEEIRQLEQKIRSLDYSSVKPCTFFDGEILKVVAESRTKKSHVTGLSQPPPFGVEGMMDMLQCDINRKAKQKTIPPGQVYVIVLDVHTFSRFCDTDAWELRRLPEYSNITLGLPPDVSGVAIIQTDFGEPSVRVHETLARCDDAKQVLERLFPSSAKAETH